MFIAGNLKKENIVEYLLYMWQLEDLIRAFNLDIDLINKNIILPQNLSTDDSRAEYEWYESLIEMMRQENVQVNGHLQINKNVVIELQDIHNGLLKSEDGAAYTAKFYHILPYISQLRSQQNTNDSDIEVCFNFLYGILLLRLKKTTISDETLKAQEEISKFMVLLAKNYKLYKSGELELD